MLELQKEELFNENIKNFPGLKEFFKFNFNKNISFSFIETITVASCNETVLENDCILLDQNGNVFFLHLNGDMKVIKFTTSKTGRFCNYEKTQSQFICNESNQFVTKNIQVVQERVKVIHFIKNTTVINQLNNHILIENNDVLIENIFVPETATHSITESINETATDYEDSPSAIKFDCVFSTNINFIPIITNFLNYYFTADLIRGPSVKYAVLQNTGLTNYFIFYIDVENNRIKVFILNDFMKVNYLNDKVNIDHLNDETGNNYIYKYAIDILNNKNVFILNKTPLAVLRKISTAISPLSFNGLIIFPMTSEFNYLLEAPCNVITANYKNINNEIFHGDLIYANDVISFKINYNEIINTIYKYKLNHTCEKFPIEFNCKSNIIQQFLYENNGCKTPISRNMSYFEIIKAWINYFNGQIDYYEIIKYSQKLIPAVFQRICREKNCKELKLIKKYVNDLDLNDQELQIEIIKSINNYEIDLKPEKNEIFIDLLNKYKLPVEEEEGIKSELKQEGEIDIYLYNK
ncbi:hypothetical protein NUSPORA_02548 [Nucleospora cyclopteri]